MNKSAKLLTSVNVNKETHREFKLLCIKHGITFKKLVNASMDMYLKDTEFRKIINNK